MMEPQEQAQLVGFQIREGADGWYTSLSIVVRTPSAPDAGMASRWFTQALRNTNSKLGRAPLPVPVPRKRLLPPPDPPTSTPIQTT